MCINCKPVHLLQQNVGQVALDRGMSSIVRAVNSILPNSFLSTRSRTLRAHRTTQVGRMVSSGIAAAAPADVGKVRVDVHATSEQFDFQYALLTGGLSPCCLQDYESLCHKLREISTLGGIGGLLQWDEAVMMPAGAAESRGKQKSVLAGVVYEKVLPFSLDFPYACSSSKLHGQQENFKQALQSFAPKPANHNAWFSPLHSQHTLNGLWLSHYLTPMQHFSSFAGDQ